MPVFEGYTTSKGRFTGTIAWGPVDLGDDDHNHLIDPEDHLAAAMLHQ
jgi:arylsulfatase